MNGFIFCDEQKENTILRYVSTELKTAELKLMKYGDFVDALSKEENSVFVIDHDLVHEIKDDFAYALTGRNISYVYYDERLFDISNSALLIEERESLVSGKEWDKAKDINTILCDIDFLLRNNSNYSYPSFFQLESTDFCNSRCIMCEHYFNDNKGACILSMEMLENLRDAIQLSRQINLNGMGEPFISKNIKEQIDTYVGYGNKIVANTNLSYLDDELIERIARDFDWLAISVDGATKETYESVRINLSFDTLMTNLHKLRDKAPDLLKIISMVIMRQNVCEMPDMVELAHEAGADQVVFLNLNPSIILGNFGDVMSNYPKVVEYYSVKAIEKGEELGVRVVVANAPNLNRSIKFEEITDELEKMNSIPKWKTPEDEKKVRDTARILNNYVEEHSQLQNTAIPSRVKCSGICDWLLSNCYTDQHGNISMCCRNFIYRAGTVDKEGGFLSIWNSKLMQDTREIFYSGHLPEACLNCGMIEGGELKYLKVEPCPEFYEDGEVKKQQKQIYKEIFGGNRDV